MLAQKEYYELFIYNNELAIVEKIGEDIFNYFKDTFEYVYHTKKGDTYPLHENFDGNIEMLIVDNEEQLYELLDDLREQEFCDTIEFNFIDDYFSGNYNQYGQGFQEVSKMNETYMIIIFHANGEEHIRSKNKDYLVALHDTLAKRGINSYVVKTAGKVN